MRKDLQKRIFKVAKALVILGKQEGKKSSQKPKIKKSPQKSKSKVASIKSKKLPIPESLQKRIDRVARALDILDKQNSTKKVKPLVDKKAETKKQKFSKIPSHLQKRINRVAKVLNILDKKEAAKPTKIKKAQDDKKKKFNAKQLILSYQKLLEKATNQLESALMGNNKLIQPAIMAIENISKRLSTELKKSPDLITASRSTTLPTDLNYTKAIVRIAKVQIKENK